MLLLVACGVASRASRAQGVVMLGDVTAVTALPGGIEVHAGAPSMKVEGLRDDVLRVHVTPDGTFAEDASWAVLPAARTARLAVTADVTIAGGVSRQARCAGRRLPLVAELAGGCASLRSGRQGRNARPARPNICGLEYGLVRLSGIDRPVVFSSLKPDGTPVDLGGSEFMVGSALLVAPGVYPEKPDAYRPELPGTVWYDFWAGARLKQTRATAEDDPDWPAVTPALERLPVYVRGGTIVPLQPLVQSTEETPDAPLEVHVYPGAGCAGTLYQDDGHTLAYQRSVFLREAFACMEGKGVLRVTLGAWGGSYVPWWQHVEVVVHGWPSAQFGVRTVGGGAVVGSRYDAADHALHVVITARTQAQTLQLTGW